MTPSSSRANSSRVSAFDSGASCSSPTTRWCDAGPGSGPRRAGACSAIPSDLPSPCCASPRPCRARSAFLVTSRDLCVRCPGRCRPGLLPPVLPPEAGRQTMGNSSPLAFQTVMTCTASASDSIRRAVTSASTSVSVRRPVRWPEVAAGRPLRSGRGVSSVEELGEVVEIGRLPIPVRRCEHVATTPLVDQTSARTSATGSVGQRSGPSRGVSWMSGQVGVVTRWPPARRSNDRTRTGRRRGPAAGRRGAPWRAGAGGPGRRPGSPGHSRRRPPRQGPPGGRARPGRHALVPGDQDGDVRRPQVPQRRIPLRCRDLRPVEQPSDMGDQVEPGHVADGLHVRFPLVVERKVRPHGGP